MKDNKNYYFCNIHYNKVHSSENSPSLFTDILLKFQITYLWCPTNVVNIDTRDRMFWGARCSFGVISRDVGIQWCTQSRDEASSNLNTCNRALKWPKLLDGDKKKLSVLYHRQIIFMKNEKIYYGSTITKCLPCNKSDYLQIK